MRINYGINRPTREPHKRRRIEHQNHHLDIEGDWDDPDFHTRLRSLVRDKHPGWSLTGYAFVEPRAWDIWCEGYVATGERGVAQHLATVTHYTFKEACAAYFKDAYCYDPTSNTYWACRLFDNAADARRSFG